MDYRGLREHYERLVARLDSSAGPLKLAGDLSVRLGEGAPKDTGTLAEAIREVGPISRSRGAWTVGVGNATRIGSPETRTPGTIASFLASSEGRALMKEAKREAAKRQRARKTRTGGSKMASVGFEKRMAWWLLPKPLKDALKDARKQGMFGGPSYTPGAPARYYFVRSGDKGNWRDSAFGAGLENHVTYFTTHALDAWRSSLPTLIREILA